MTDWAALLGDRFLLAHIRRQEKSRSRGREDAPQVHSPTQVIGEQRAFALLIHAEEQRLLKHDPARKGERLSENILAAVPYLWLTNIGNMARDLPIPEHIVPPDLLPFPLCWWTFEGALPMVVANTQEQVALSDAWLIADKPNAYHIAVLGASSTGRGGLLAIASVSKYARWPDGVEENYRPLVGYFLSMMSFLNSPFVSSETQRPAKRLHGTVRHDVRPSPERVVFVRLRKEAAEQVRSDGQSGAGHYSVRWIVRGHHRAQWYPSLKAHRVLWVAPYVKGPADKPLKAPAYAVVR